MRLGVSAWRLQGQRLGIGRYIEYLIKYWGKMLAAPDRVIVYTHQPLDEGFSDLPGTIENRLVRPKLTNALWENLLLPRAAAGLDVLFGPSYTLPLAYRGRTVVAIHSVDEAAGIHSLWHRMTYTQKYRLSALKADIVIANAHSTKERLAEYYGIPREKIEVVWLGVDESFRPIDDPAVLRRTREQYLGSDRPYILFAGGLSRRRNIPALLAAFALLKSRDKIPHCLLLFGPNRGNVPLRELAESLSISDSVVHTDGRFSDHTRLVPIYAAADLFVLPSSSEGFSLTLVEAMSCGTPAITTNRAALGEVANGYALTLEEPTVEALAEAMRSVLGDPALRESLRARGLERARQFRWETTARRTLDILRRVAESAPA